MIRAMVVTLAFAAALGAGCNSVEVRSDADADYDFASLATFAVRPIDPRVERIPELGPGSLGRIESSVAESFRARGFTPAPAEKADFTLVIHPSVHDRVEVVAYGYAPGTVALWGQYRGTHYGGFGTRQACEYREGTLVLDAVADGKAVWRGWAQAPVGETPDPAGLREAIDAIAATFPAGRSR